MAAAKTEAASVLKRPGTLRLIDANLNRCREGLRVLEDTARFLWSDETLFRRFRKHRHELDRLTRELYPRLIASRSSGSDAGRTLKESGRESLKAILSANFRRCEESLRVLEEYGKLFSGTAGTEFKKIRFQMYGLEKKTLTRGS